MEAYRESLGLPQTIRRLRFASMIDEFDATHDKLRLVVAKALRGYEEIELLCYLRDPDPILRTSAGRELHLRGTASAFSDAIALVKHTRHDMREIGAFVLGQLGTPTCPFAAQSIQPLCVLLDDPYHEVRSAAVSSLGFLASLGHQPAPEILDRMLLLASDQMTTVRLSLAGALSVIHAIAARHCLEQICHDTDATVRDAAEFGLQMHDERK
jgi:HEAT repeat protein